MRLVDGPLAGREIADPPRCARVVVPSVETCGQEGCLHFPQHVYTPDGHWLSSSTYMNWQWYRDKLKAEILALEDDE